MRKENIAIRKVVGANSDDLVQTRVKADGFITGLVVRFYAGQELALQVKPYILNKGTQSIDPIFTFPNGTKDYLIGDDDNFKYAVHVPVSYDDEIHVQLKNTSIYDYDAVIDIEILYGD